MPTVRFQWPCPGDRLQMNTKRFAAFRAPRASGCRDRGLGTSAEERMRVSWEFVHSVIDDHATTIADRQRVDLHPATARSLACSPSTRSGIAPSRHAPPTQRKDRAPPVARAWAYGQRYRSRTARAAALPHWLEHYNRGRPHSEIGNRPPTSRAPNLPRQDISFADLLRVLAGEHRELVVQGLQLAVVIADTHPDRRVCGAGATDPRPKCEGRP